MRQNTSAEWSVAGDVLCVTRTRCMSLFLRPASQGQVRGQIPALWPSYGGLGAGSNYSTRCLETRSKPLNSQEACSLHWCSSHCCSVITGQSPTPIRAFLYPSLGHSGSSCLPRDSVAPVQTAASQQKGVVFCPLLILGRNSRAESATGGLTR